MRYKATLAYDGYNYAGFQTQLNSLAIQDVIEEKLKIICGYPVSLVMAARTDSGVHALGQVVHFDLVKECLPLKLQNSLNALLPKDIYIKKIEAVEPHFHARYDAEGKKYLYLINHGEKDLFLNHRAYYSYQVLDVAKMRTAAALFVGKHDFTTFNTTALAEVSDQTREIYSLTIKEKPHLILIEICGNGFLRHMVRMIVGTLTEVGKGQRTLAEVERMLNFPNKNQRRYNIVPYGLYLAEVYYR